MRTVYLGSSLFSSNILRSLYKKGIEFPLVITKKPKEKGRGKRKRPTPVGLIAREFSLPLIEIDNPNNSEIEEAIRETGVDVLLLAAYGAILKDNILSTVTYPINIHPSLLPKYRGVAPIKRAIINGEKKTGVTIFIMNIEIDTGGIVIQKEINIEPDEIASELEQRLANVSVDLTLSILKELESGRPLKTTSQNEKGAIYAPRIRKEELRINWKESAVKVSDKIKGLSYSPGAYTHFRGKRLKIIRARTREENLGDSFPGEVVEVGGAIVVTCGIGSVEIIQLQPSGKKMMDSRAFVNGYHIKVGERME